MQIDKAIGILTALKEGIDVDELPDDQPAIQLGIEALKRVKAGRENEPPWPYSQLPGETR